MENNVSFDINYLVDCGLTNVLQRIIKNLTTTEQICLAATCKNIRNYIQTLPNQMSIQEHKAFNLDIFPRFITTKEINTLYTVHPYLETLKLDFSFAKDHLLDSLQKFKGLRKICFYLSEDDYNYNAGQLRVKSLTIRHTFEWSLFDPLYNLLEQFSSFESISIYKGFLSLPTLQILGSQHLVELKIQDVIIMKSQCWILIKQILENKNLKKLKLVSYDYERCPHPILIMSDIVGHLLMRPLEIEFLKFTLDQNTRILYRNLKNLKTLKKLTIYYNVQESTRNLDEIIRIVASLSVRDIKFIEYVYAFDSNCYTAKMIRRSENASTFYVNVIKSMDKYMDVHPIDYSEYFVEKQV